MSRMIQETWGMLELKVYNFQDNARFYNKNQLSVRSAAKTKILSRVWDRMGYIKGSGFSQDYTGRHKTWVF